MSHALFGLLLLHFLGGGFKLDSFVARAIGAGNITRPGGPGKAQPADVLRKSSGRSLLSRWPTRLTLARKPDSKPTFFETAEDGVRLPMWGSSPPEPDAVDPVELERSALVVTYDYEEYFVGLMVRCNPNKDVLSSPLLVDLFLKHGTSRQKNEWELDRVLTEYQVSTQEQALNMISLINRMPNCD